MGKFKLRWPSAGVVVGIIALVMAMGGVGYAASSASGPKVLEVHKTGTFALAHPPNTTNLVHLRLPAGKWLVSAKLWGDSVSSTTNPTTTVRCGLAPGKSATSPAEDISVFNTPRASGTSAGVIYLQAVTRKAAVNMNCDDISSNAQVHDIVLTATQVS